MPSSSGETAGKWGRDQRDLQLLSQGGEDVALGMAAAEAVGDRTDRPQEPRIVGYRASNVIEVRLDDLEKVGPVIDAGIEAALERDQVVRQQLHAVSDVG